MTVPVIKLGHAIVAIMAILIILAIMARVDIARDMVVIGVYAKSRKNVDHPRVFSEEKLRSGQVFSGHNRSKIGTKSSKNRSKVWKIGANWDQNTSKLS